MSTDSKPLAYRKTPEEINDLAANITQNHTFLLWSHQVDEIRESWMLLLAYAEPGTFTEESLADVGAWYADYADAFPVAVNGQPIFSSVAFVHVDDVDALVARLREIHAVLHPKP